MLVGAARLPNLAFKIPYLLPMAAPFDRLKAALADRYTLERELGAGGMATVYLAHDCATIARSRSRSCVPSSRRSSAPSGS